MSQQLVNLQGGIVVGDNAATANAAVVRDNNGAAHLNTYCDLLLSILGNLFASGTAVAASVTLGSAGYTTTVFKASAAGGAITLTLPAASASSGLCYLVIKTDSTANVVTLKGAGTDNINAANTYTGLSTQWYAAILWCDGTQWYAQKLMP